MSTLAIKNGKNQWILFNQSLKFPLLRSHGDEGWDREDKWKKVYCFGRILDLAAASTFSGRVETYQVRDKRTHRDQAQQQQVELKGITRPCL